MEGFQITDAKVSCGMTNDLKRVKIVWGFWNSRVDLRIKPRVWNALDLIVSLCRLKFHLESSYIERNLFFLLKNDNNQKQSLTCYISFRQKKILFID